MITYDIVKWGEEVQNHNNADNVTYVQPPGVESFSEKPDIC